jgi:Zn-dependent peptidase ImmA (M78 family)
MKISRMDLDGTGSLSGIVARILKLEPDLPIPVPIEELALQLDIQKIQQFDSEQFEGGLITDETRSSGIILVNRSSFKGRRRFTIGHELAHFLIPSHMPDEPGRFLCSREDMGRLGTAEQSRRGRMEVEANQFAALILLPPPALRIAMKAYRDPDLKHVPQLARQFDVSKEAASRAYAEFNEHAVAIVVTENGKVRRTYRKLNFPRIAVDYGRPVPMGSQFHKKGLDQSFASELAECVPDVWLDVERGRRAPTLYEQVYPQRNGFALIMLWLELPEDDEDEQDDDRTSKERLRDRQARYVR